MPQQGEMTGNSAQLSKQVRGETVSKRVRMDSLGNASPPGHSPAGAPHGLRSDRLVRTAYQQAGKQPAVFPLHRAVVGPKLVQQLRTERHLKVFTARALTNADHHAFLVDVSGTEVAQLSPAHSGGLERHQNGAMP